LRRACAAPAPRLRRACATSLRHEHGAPYPFVTFYLNDEDVRLVGGFGVSVTEGDEVTIVPAAAGG
jgi:molybdopterin converting factor small subunit